MNDRNHLKNYSGLRKPSWLKIKLPDVTKSGSVVSLIKEHHLNTICSSGMCPNRGECWCNGTATFMIGGDVCTRSCKFCATKSGKPLFEPNAKEIEGIIDSIKRLGLKHVVITSVDRDDLKDGGANHWAKMINSIHSECENITIEALIPDFQGKKDLIDLVVSTRPDVISHNLETVRSLTPIIRSVATYDVSLEVLKYVNQKGIKTKSGIMLGLGEEEWEILETMDDLLKVGCSILTIGQYLQPTTANYPVKNYIPPEKFLEYKNIGLKKGFRFVESSPLVRTSYHAEKHVL